MSKKNFLSSKDKFIFRKLIRGTKEITQDTIYYSNNNLCFLSCKMKEHNEHLHRDYFSHTHSRNKLHNNPLYYIRYDCSANRLKKLKKGHYIPEIFLDLHGLNKFQAKVELGKLMYFCVKKKIKCVNVMHGYGKNILKEKIPLWLSRHPNVIALHQSPKIFGNDAAVLVLIDFS
ncbi:endonuclease SmrB [Buchnera aphidicola]|uniref:endonuclease SmrB n=1 Tax=Buchnera aphidicola TaxID=9 RepID=UPI002093F9AC|nr:endonuclease SmrB [Buchnera aphidicola]USS94199.1 endonuclease SmrB [Buchnera aphidicola (Sipha maydis)]